MRPIARSFPGASRHAAPLAGAAQRGDEAPRAGGTPLAGAAQRGDEAPLASAPARVASTPLAIAARLAAAALLLALASCAPVPPQPGAPGVPPVPGQPPARPGAPAPAPPQPAGPLVLHGEPVLTVGLAWDLDTLSIEPAAGFAPATHDWPHARMVPATRGPIRFRSYARGVAVESAHGRGWSMEMIAAPAETCWLAGGDARGVTGEWNGKHWHGALGVFLNPRGKLTLVTRIPLESYLRGVVPGEIGALDDDHIEAGKAQAIAARSYTMFYRGRRASEGFDLYGTVDDQLYSQVESERPLASRCVDETRGEMALAAGQPIRANYCSTCGGISAEVWEAWPAPALAYLVSQRDRGRGDDWCVASPLYRWSETWSAAEFTGNLAKFGPQFGVALPPGGVGQLVDVEVGARSRSGRVWRLHVRTTTGDVWIPAYVCRQVLRRGGQPGAILRSNLFKIAVRRDPRTRAALAVVASGAGSGHGVGLCQTGALGMAKAGEKATAILAHYYPGAEIKTLY